MLQLTQYFVDCSVVNRTFSETIGIVVIAVAAFVFVYTTFRSFCGHAFAVPCPQVY